MRDRQRTTNTNEFYDYDLSKVPVQDEPHILFFDEQKPVVVFRSKNHMQVFVNDCIVEAEYSLRQSHEQYILIDLFSKGLYYKNISKYKNFPSLFKSLKSTRSNPEKRTKEFADILKKAIDAQIGRIEILESGVIVTHAYEPIKFEEIQELIKNDPFF